MTKQSLILRVLTIIVLLSMFVTTVYAEIIIEDKGSYDESRRMIDISLKIKVIGTEANNLDIKIAQRSDHAILDYDKGLFDSFVGPADNPPEVIKNGIFSYTIPLLKEGQYVTMRFTASNIKCGDVVVGILDITYTDKRGKQSEPSRNLIVNVPDKICNPDIGMNKLVGFFIIVLVIGYAIIYIMRKKDKDRTESEDKL